MNLKKNLSMISRVPWNLSHRSNNKKRISFLLNKMTCSENLITTLIFIIDKQRIVEVIAQLLSRED